MKVNDFEWKGANVLVTGASGFKGSWLCSALLKLKANVYGTTRHQLNPLSAYNILDLDKRIAQVSIDISERQHVYDIINSIKPDVILHLAATSLVPVALRDPIRTFEVNIMGTLNILEACRRLGVCDRLLICSTDHVFGIARPDEVPTAGFEEISRVSYGGPYDTSKAAMELAVRSYYYAYWRELPSIGITRAANVFGYGDVNQRRVIPEFVRKSLDAGCISVRYKDNGRQFLHVTDAITGYIRAASSLNEGGCNAKQNKKPPEDRSPFTPTFHFAMERYDGSGVPYIRIGELASLIASTLGSTVDLSKSGDYAPHENQIQALSCLQTRNALGWEARKPFKVAVRQLADWYNQAGNLASLKTLIESDLQELIDNL